MLIWDEAKRSANLEKHGVDFRALAELDWDRAWVFEDRRRDYGETRLIALVPLGRRLHAVVYTERKGTRRIISARKANSREVAAYENALDQTDT
ncbi:MAG: BrnT family toxin [Tagaea sp.]